MKLEVRFHRRVSASGARGTFRTVWEMREHIVISFWFGIAGSHFPDYVGVLKNFTTKYIPKVCCSNNVRLSVAMSARSQAMSRNFFASRKGQESEYSEIRLNRTNCESTLKLGAKTGLQYLQICPKKRQQDKWNVLLWLEVRVCENVVAYTPASKGTIFDENL